MENEHSRFIRQEELVPQERLRSVKTTVIGVGGAPDVSGQAQ